MHLNIWMTMKTEQGGWWMVSFTDRRAPQDPPTGRSGRAGRSGTGSIGAPAGSAGGLDGFSR